MKYLALFSLICPLFLGCHHKPGIQAPNVLGARPENFKAIMDGVSNQDIVGVACSYYEFELNGRVLRSTTDGKLIPLTGVKFYRLVATDEWEPLRAKVQLNGDFAFAAVSFWHWVLEETDSEGNPTGKLLSPRVFVQLRHPRCENFTLKLVDERTSDIEIIMTCEQGT